MLEPLIKQSQLTMQILTFEIHSVSLYQQIFLSTFYLILLHLSYLIA